MIPGRDIMWALFMCVVVMAVTVGLVIAVKWGERF